MPVWSPSRATDWNRLDTIITDPMRKCLGLPKSTHLQSLLVEMNMLSVRRQYDILAMTTCHRALSLPDSHQSHIVVRSQQAWPVTQVRNRPIPARAAATCRKHGAPKVLAAKSELPPRKLLVTKALCLQRIDWRQNPQGKRLQNLATVGPRIPEYFRYDARPIAVTRARLRFDRAALAESRIRRGETTIPPNCPTCLVVDSLSHLLHDCKLLPREQLLSDARKAALPVNDHYDFDRWMLGSLDLLDKKLRKKALEISGKFLLASSLNRKL